MFGQIRIQIPTSYADEISTLKTDGRSQLTWIDNNLEQTGKCGVPNTTSNNTFDMHVWPNPVANPLTLSITSDKEQSVQVVVVNFAGQKILTDNKNLSPGVNEFNYSSASWSSGIYLIKAILQDGTTRSIKLKK